MARRSQLAPVMSTSSLDASAGRLPGLFRPERHWAERTTARHLKPFVHGHWALLPVPLAAPRPSEGPRWPVLVIAGATAGVTFAATVSLGGWLILALALLAR